MIATALNIRHKTILATVTAVILIIVVLISITLSQGQKIILNKTYSQQMPAALGEVSNQIQLELEKPLVVAEVMSQLQPLAEFDGQGSRQIRAQLASIQQQFNALTAFFSLPRSTIATICQVVSSSLCRNHHLMTNGFMLSLMVINRPSCRLILMRGLVSQRFFC
ncbi:hypothetical protein QW180_21765 [Vibrio sinaloensis]|nr:hypothetical protein [Vibrio sinaloensis]